jgi:hypothetical protein
LEAAVADLFGTQDSLMLLVGELEAQLGLYGVRIDITHQQIQQTYKEK